MPLDADQLIQLNRQAGETLGTVKAMLETQRESKADQADFRKQVDESARRLEDRLSSQMRTITHERRQTEQVMAGQIELLRNQVKEIDAKAASITDDVDDVKTAVKTVTADLAKMQIPVAKLLEIKDNVIRYGLILIGIITVVWYAIGPVIQALLGGWLSRLAGLK